MDDVYDINIDDTFTGTSKLQWFYTNSVDSLFDCNLDNGQTYEQSIELVSSDCLYQNIVGSEIPDTNCCGVSISGDSGGNGPTNLSLDYSGLTNSYCEIKWLFKGKVIWGGGLAFETYRYLKVRITHCNLNPETLTESTGTYTINGFS